MVKQVLRTALLMLCILCMIHEVNAVEWSSSLYKFDVKDPTSIQEARNLIGRTLIYIPSAKGNSFNNYLGDKLCTVKVVSVEGKNIEKMEITFKELPNGPQKTINFSFMGKHREGYHRSEDFRFLDYDKWNNGYVFRTYTDPMIKGEFKVTDSGIKRLDDGSLLNYAVVENNTIGLNKTIEWNGEDDINVLFEEVKVKVWNPKYTIITPSGEKLNVNGKYDNQYFSLSFSLNNRGLSFTLKNKSNQPISIVWDNASYADPNKKASKLVHNGIKLIDRMAPQSPTSIPPGAEITDDLVPTDNIYHKDYEGWKIKGVMDNVTANVNDQRTISFVLPIEISGKIQYYTINVTLTYLYKHPEWLNLR